MHLFNGHVCQGFGRAQAQAKLQLSFQARIHVVIGCASHRPKELQVVHRPSLQSDHDRIDSEQLVSDIDVEEQGVQRCIVQEWHKCWS